MQLTYKYQINASNELLNLCKISKDLYNQALYEIRTSLSESNRFIFYSELEKIMKNKVNLEGEINYRLLKAQVSQQTLMSLDKNIKSYIKSVKDWSKNRSKYKGMPKLPDYKLIYNNLTFTNQCCQIKNQYIILSKSIKIPIPQWKDEFDKFQQVRILPKHNYLEVEIIYDKECYNADVNETSFSSIDLGINNFITLVSENTQPLIINGKQIKSLNQFYNKQKSYLYSIKDKMNLKYTNKLYKLDKNRNNKINDIIHKTSRFIVNYLIKNKIGNLVVGYNEKWKDSIKLGSKTN